MLLMGVIKMTEEAVKNLKFGECVTDGNGNKYTRTIGGWIYSTFAGNACFVPDLAETEVKESLTTEKADKKAKGK